MILKSLLFCIAFWFIFNTIAYIICPKQLIKEKKEYVYFILIFGSIFFTVFTIAGLLVQDLRWWGFLFGMASAPSLFLFHLVYPFRKTARNQHVTFFTGTISLFTIGVAVFMCVIYALTVNM